MAQLEPIDCKFYNSAAMANITWECHSDEMEARYISNNLGCVNYIEFFESNELGIWNGKEPHLEPEADRLESSQTLQRVNFDEVHEYVADTRKIRR